MLDDHEVNELYAIFHVHSYDKLIDSLDEESLDIVTKYISQGFDKDMDHHLRLDHAVISPMEDILKDKSKDEKISLIFQVGRLSGILETLNRISYEKNQDEWSLAKFRDNNIPEFDLVIKLIYKSGVYDINKIAKALNIDVNKMHSILSDMRDLGAITYYTIGVFIASIGLTDFGLRYAKQLCS